jgi:hypothetical protein
LNWKQFSYLLLFFAFQNFALAQSEDHTEKDGFVIDSIYYKTHSSGKAGLYSALLPGAGQFYNRKYWKIPIIVTAFFLTGGYIAKNNKKFKDYKNEAINRYNHQTINNFPNLTDNEVLQLKEKYEKQRNIGILVIVGLYILQIADATVDAQFFTFDVSPDVTLHAEPYIRQSEFDFTAPINTGLTLSLNF